MPGPDQSSAPPPTPSRRERFFEYFWFILKNVVGWMLILLSLVAGPLVPGPGGIPLFLVGFALITFPGKRKLTAHLLRGRRIGAGSRPIVLSTVAIALALPALGLWLASTWSHRLDALHARGALAVVGVYLTGVAATCLVIGGAWWLLNLLARWMPPIRRRVRPWLRHHRIRLLPPRRRRRLPHEHGTGPVRLKDEILGILKRPHPSTHRDT